MPAPQRSAPWCVRMTARIRQSAFGNAIARGPFRPKRRVVLRSGGFPQNKPHRDFIATLPCILIDDPRHQCSGRVECAHVGSRGGSQKSPDEETLPMCVNGHRTGKKAFHKGDKTFWAYWIIPSKEFLIQKYVDLGFLHGTIKEDSLWTQKYKNSKGI